MQAGDRDKALSAFREVRVNGPVTIAVRMPSVVPYRLKWAALELLARLGLAYRMKGASDDVATITLTIGCPLPAGVRGVQLTGRPGDTLALGWALADGMADELVEILDVPSRLCIGIDLADVFEQWLGRRNEYPVRQYDVDGNVPHRHGTLAPELDGVPVAELLANLVHGALQAAARASGLPLPPRRTPWPDGKLFAAHLSHDVDSISGRYDIWRRYAGWSALYLGNRLLGRQTDSYRQKIRRWWEEPSDPQYCIPEWLELEARYGATSSFYFLCSRTGIMWHQKASRMYALKSGVVRRAVRLVVASGWEAGVHGLYPDHVSPRSLRRQKSLLEEVAGSDVAGIRQHYLHLAVPQTWRAQKEAGFEYDATLGWNYHIGMRAGTCRPFELFDVERSEPIGLMELPLIAMDGPMLREYGRPNRWMQDLRPIMDRVRSVGGCLSVLMHQDHLDEVDFPGQRAFYSDLLAELGAAGGYARSGREIIQAERVFRESLAGDGPSIGRHPELTGSGPGKRREPPRCENAQEPHVGQEAMPAEPRQSKNANPAAGALWLAVGSSVNMAAMLVLFGILSRTLDKSTYGIYRQVWMIGSALAVLMSMGVPQAVLYYMPQLQQKRNRLQTIVRGQLLLLIGGILGAFLIYCLAGPISRFVGGSHDLVPALRHFWPVIIFWPLSVRIAVMFMAVEVPRLAGFMNALFMTSMAAAGALMMQFQSCLPSLFWAQAVAGFGFAILACALLTRAARHVPAALRLAPPRPDEKPVRAWQIIRFAAPLSVGVLLAIMSGIVDRIVVARGASDADFAVFVNGALEMPIGMILVGSVFMTIQPLLVRHIAAGQRDHFLTLWNSATTNVATVVFPISCFLALFSTDIMVLIYGQTYQASGLIFLMYSIGMMPRIQSPDTVIEATGRTKFILFLSLFALINNVIFAAAGMWLYGLIGVAVACMIQRFVLAFVFAWLSCRALGVSLWRDMPWGPLGWRLLAALITTVLCAWTHWLPLPPPFRVLLGMILFGLLYYVVSRRLNVMSPQHFDFARRLIPWQRRAP